MKSSFPEVGQQYILSNQTILKVIRIMDDRMIMIALVPGPNTNWDTKTEHNVLRDWFSRHGGVLYCDKSRSFNNLYQKLSS